MASAPVFLWSLEPAVASFFVLSLFVLSLAALAHLFVFDVRIPALHPKAFGLCLVPAAGRRFARPAAQIPDLTAFALAGRSPCFVVFCLSFFFLL